MDECTHCKYELNDGDLVSIVGDEESFYHSFLPNAGAQPADLARLDCLGEAVKSAEKGLYAEQEGMYWKGQILGILPDTFEGVSYDNVVYDGQVVGQKVVITNKRIRGICDEEAANKQE